jgi:hypothetical protein
MRPPLHIVRILNGQAVEYNSAAEAAVFSGISEPHLYVLIRTGRPAADGSVFVRAKDYKGVATPFERPFGFVLPVKPAKARQAAVEPNGFEAGRYNTPAMQDWISACWDSLPEGVRLKSLDSQIERTNVRDGAALRLTVRFQTPTARLSYHDIRVLGEQGWNTAQPWNDARRNSAFYRAEEFALTAEGKAKK